MADAWRGVGMACMWGNVKIESNRSVYEVHRRGYLNVYLLFVGCFVVCPVGVDGRNGLLVFFLGSYRVL